MIKAFLFDIDGTLVDSNDLQARAWERAFAANGRAVSFHNIRLHLGKGAEQLLSEFLTRGEIQDIGNAIAEKRGEIFKREYLAQVRPFPRVRTLLRKIRDAGPRIALLSTSSREEVEQYKILTQIGDLVEKNTSTSPAHISQPDPDSFHAAMQSLENPARDTVLVVGDTPDDAIAATQANLPVIGVLCGGFAEKYLLASGCRAVYQDPEDLLKNLAEIMKD